MTEFRVLNALAKTFLRREFQATWRHFPCFPEKCAHFAIFRLGVDMILSMHAQARNQSVRTLLEGGATDCMRFAGMVRPIIIN